MPLSTIYGRSNGGVAGRGGGGGLPMAKRGSGGML